MAAIINITGNLTRDPVLRESGNGSFYTFSVGVRTRQKDADGNYKSDFYDCTINGKLGAFFGQRAKKGNRVFVSGDIYTRAYTDKNGVERTSLSISANAAELLERPQANDNGNAAPAQSRPAPQPVEDPNDLPF